jgi:hypothetical protein
LLASTDDRNIWPRKMTGRCATGAARDKGQLYHAVSSRAFPSYGTALCGAKPGQRGNGWSDHIGDAVTCPRCLAKMARG